MSSYVLKISGKRIDTFVMLLIKLKINFIIIKRKKDYLIIEVLEEEYADLLKIKTTYKIEIVKRKGLINIINFIKTRKLFVTIVFLGLIFLNVLTNLVFSIEIITTNNDIKNLILNDLEEFGLKKYSLKVSYQKKEEIEQKILKKEQELIEWIEIEEKGTSYEIKLIERIKDDIKEETEPRHIIAKKKGLITKIIAEQGEVVTKKNAYVNEGDILISGLIKNNDNIVSKTRAEGKVYAEIWYKVSLNLPKSYHEEKKTGKSKKILEISFVNNNYSLLDFNKYEYSKDSKEILYKNPILPISFNLTKKEEVEIENINFSESYEKNIKPLAIEKLKTKLGSDINILDEKVLKKETKADTIDIDIFFKVEEDITSYSSLKNFDIELENEKIEKESSE